MNARFRPPILIASAACLIVAAACSAQRPNVILISLDTTRADHMSVYGYERDTTPNLKRFAAEGVVFEQAFAQAPWTVSSHMSVFTSLYPPVHKVAHLTPQSATVETLPERLKSADYSTGGFVAPVLDGYGFSRGFDHYFSPYRSRPAEVMVQQALKWLARDPSRPVLQPQPFFLFLHLFDAHHPYEPSWPFDTAYIESYREDIRELSSSHPHQQDKNLSPEELNEVVSLYDGEIAYLDFALGGFFEALRKLGVYDSSLIVLMGDHGEGFLEHGLMNHGNSVYDELVRVPLLVRFPRGRFAGRRVETPVELMDITPTVLELLGEERLAVAQGDSLGGLLEKGEDESRFVYAYDGDADSVRTAEWKLIKNPPNRARRIPRALPGEYELYDLVRDPGEMHNLAPRMSERVSTMTRALEEMERINDELRGKVQTELGVHPIELTETEKERLRTLGYIQ
ncbi:MAG TPA: sulfatase [Vicinamibacteria bacterium]|nr:sulfatase [Vicinamibacteria bacterium]